MQQFTVPQFIDVEDKIIGPITTRQFVIMLSGFIFIAISYKIFDFSLFLTVGILTLVITGIFAFARINGRPFHLFLLNVAQTLKKARLRVWNSRKMALINVESDEVVKNAPEIKPTGKRTIGRSRLDDLSLVVDTGGAYKGEKKDDII